MENNKKEYQKAWREANKEKLKAYREANREKRLASMKAWRESNKEKRASYDKQWKKDNADHRKEYMTDYYSNTMEQRKLVYEKWKAENQDHIKKRNKEYYENNRDKRCYWQSVRDATKTNAMPKWLSKEHKQQMKDMYKECFEISKTSGIPHNVDHIYPLQGENSCGLHVPWNLQIITAVENISKKNHLPINFLPHCSS
jgi:hypothetical protein